MKTIVLCTLLAASATASCPPQPSYSTKSLPIVPAAVSTPSPSLNASALRIRDLGMGDVGAYFNPVGNATRASTYGAINNVLVTEVKTTYMFAMPPAPRTTSSAAVSPVAGPAPLAPRATPAPAGWPSFRPTSVLTAPNC